MIKREPIKHLYEQMVTISDSYAHKLFNFSKLQDLERILKSLFKAVRIDVEVIPETNVNSGKLYYVIYLRYAISDNKLLKISELKDIKNMEGERMQ